MKHQQVPVRLLQYFNTFLIPNPSVHALNEKIEPPGCIGARQVVCAFLKTPSFDLVDTNNVQLQAHRARLRKTLRTILRWKQLSLRVEYERVSCLLLLAEFPDGVLLEAGVHDLLSQFCGRGDVTPHWTQTERRTSVQDGS